ncbi:MAG: serine hydrolase domain-containing protein [Wenzhouxiangella sp.]
MSTFAPWLDRLDRWQPGHRLFGGLLAALIALAVTGCAVRPPDHPNSLNIARLDQHAQALARRGFAGQILVATPEDIVFLKGYGPRKPNQPERIAGDHVMPLASVTKPLTASLVLDLAAAGLIELDHPIGDYLDALDPAWQQVPIRYFLSHQAGLPAEIVNRDWPGEPRFEPVDRDAFIARLAHFPPDHPPGEGFNYSNVGYGLMAALIETVTGQTFEQALATRLLAPNHIAGIGFDRPAWGERQMVHGRQGPQDRGHYHDRPRLPDGLGFNLRGAGDLQAEPAALAAWWQSIHERQWLPSPWLDLWLEPVVEEPDGSDYGLGLHFRSTDHGPVVGHTGGDFVFAIDWSWFRDHDVLVVISSADPLQEADLIRDRLHRALFSGRSFR